MSKPTDKAHRPEIVHPQAEPFDDKRMAIARTVTESLPIHLSEAEALERGQEAARKRAQARHLANALADHAKQVKADIKALENRAEHLERQCETESEITDVECDIIFDYEKGEARTVRRDTNQVLRHLTRSLRKDEMQIQLSLEPRLRAVPNDETADSVLPFVVPGLTQESDTWETDRDHDDDDAGEIVDPLSDDINFAVEGVGVFTVSDAVSGIASPSKQQGITDAVQYILSREGAKGATDRALVSELLQAGAFGNDATAIAVDVSAALDTLKANGRAKGRKGPGKRWWAV